MVQGTTEIGPCFCSCCKWLCIRDFLELGSFIGLHRSSHSSSLHRLWEWFGNGKLELSAIETGFWSVGSSRGACRSSTPQSSLALLLEVSEIGFLKKNNASVTSNTQLSSKCNAAFSERIKQHGKNASSQEKLIPPES